MATGLNIREKNNHRSSTLEFNLMHRTKNKHKPLQRKQNKTKLKLHWENPSSFFASASACKGGYTPTVHICCLPLTDFGFTVQCSTSSHPCGGLMMERTLGTWHVRTPVLRAQLHHACWNGRSIWELMSVGCPDWRVLAQVQDGLVDHGVRPVIP